LAGVPPSRPLDPEELHFLLKVGYYGASAISALVLAVLGFQAVQVLGAVAWSVVARLMNRG